MGRNKAIRRKTILFSEMSKEEKINIFNTFELLIESELAMMGEEQLQVGKEITKGIGAEDIAVQYYESHGFEVYRSRVKNGYRAICAERFWPEYLDKLTEEDKKMLNKIHAILTDKEFTEISSAIRYKSGTPDLLLVKDGKIRFVEVKSDNETVKSSTVKFFIEHKEKWSVSILRVRRS